MGYSDEQLAIIALHMCQDIGPRRLQNLMAHFGSAVGVLAASEGELTHTEGITPNLARQILRAKCADAEKEIARAGKAGARIVTCVDASYPAELKNIASYPPVICVLGDIIADDLLSVALVGTRRPTAYGRNVAETFARQFANEGVTTISGLARGIDTEVHQATLAAGGRTIAVLGNGLNHHYPVENRALGERIAARGALVSEFPMDFPPDRGNFPRRNRIIAGLALATLVVEADLKSGALITAGFALEQGKDVFAVPGPVFSKYSQGPHNLLRQGAQVAESAADVISAIQPMAEWCARRSRAQELPRTMPLLDDSQQNVLAILSQEPEGMSIDSIGVRTKLAVGELAQCMLDLELKGLVRSLPGRMYIVKR
jgi:DNA processing protein